MLAGGVAFGGLLLTSCASPERQRRSATSAPFTLRECLWSPHANDSRDPTNAAQGVGLDAPVA